MNYTETLNKYSVYIITYSCNNKRRNKWIQKE